MCVGPTKPAVLLHAGMAFIVDSKGHYPARCLVAASDGCGHGHFLFLRMNTPPPPTTTFAEPDVLATWVRALYLTL